MQKRLIDSLRFIAARGALYNPRTRKNLKMPLRCDLRSVRQMLRKDPAGGPCRKYAEAEFEYRGRLYRTNFRAGWQRVMQLARDGVRRVVFYPRVISSPRINAVAYILLAMDEKKGGGNVSLGSCREVRR